jgi:ADP-ribose pyrophosphatase YjhB (NUDIX family)
LQPTLAQSLGRPALVNGEGFGDLRQRGRRRRWAAFGVTPGMLVMKFCPQCGQNLTYQQHAGRSRPTCTDCGFVHMGSLTVGVGGVVIRDGKVLLARRAIPPAVGAWTIPGGYVESDELLEEAVVREVQEETAVLASIRSLISVRSVVHRDHLDTYLVFHLEYVQGDAVADGTEIDQVGWFAPHELDGLVGLTPFSRRIASDVLRNGEGLERVPYLRPGGEPADCFAIRTYEATL